MNTSDWITVLAIATTIIGVVKKANRRTAKEQQPAGKESGTEEWGAEETEMDTVCTFQECGESEVPGSPEEISMPGDYFSSSEKQQDTFFQSNTEEEEEESPAEFDLRRAVISSEILHRPHF